jgi:hypothetical protein
MLLALGLIVFFKCYGLLLSETHNILEGGTLAFIGIVIFRGGIHLLKIAVAAQVCQSAQEALARPAAGVTAPIARRRPVVTTAGRRLT